MNKLPITVIIPFRRQEQWLEGAVDSAWAAGARQVCIFDDANPQWVNRTISMKSHVLREDIRCGVVFGRNKLIELASTDLIFPLDADDRLYPDALERLYAAWQPGTWVYGRYTEIDEDEQVIREMDAPPPGMLRQKNLTYSSFLYHRDDWARVGGYDPDFEPLEEDYAFQCALVHHGVRPVRLDGAPIYKRMIHTNSRTARAMKYWAIAQELCREKWPGAFV